EVARTTGLMNGSRLPALCGFAISGAPMRAMDLAGFGFAAGLAACAIAGAFAAGLAAAGALAAFCAGACVAGCATGLAAGAMAAFGCAGAAATFALGLAAAPFTVCEGGAVCAIPA